MKSIELLLAALGLAAVVALGSLAWSVSKLNLGNLPSVNSPVTVSVNGAGGSGGSSEARPGEGLFGTGLSTKTIGGELDVTGTTTISLLDTIVLGNGQTIDGHFFATSTRDPASIGSGSVTTSDMTVTGATAGDTVTAFSPAWTGAATTSVMLRGYVSAANTVTLTWQNTSSSAVNLTDHVVHVNVWSHSSQGG